MPDVPDPVPLDLFRSLVDAAGGVTQASHRAHVHARIMSRWYSGEATPIPWTVAYVLRDLQIRGESDQPGNSA